MNNLEHIQGNKYALAILLADATEERVRHGEILAPAWFMRAWCDAVRVIADIQAAS